uniref:Spermatogenesis-associated protein 31E1-like n=1 Tax=Oryctolagus cuniculus TaxID=9986 RepID=G1SUT6_RABIT
MRPGSYSILPKGTPRAQLPAGDSEIRLMEHQLLPPQSAPVPWQRSSCASWSTDLVLLLLFGLGLFFLFLVHSTPSSRPPKKKGTIRKGQVQTWRKTRNKKKSATLKACRDCLEELKEARGLVSLLQSHLGKLPDNSASHLLCRDLQGDERNPAPAGGHQPHGEPEEDASPVTSSPLPSPALLTQHPPPPASRPSEGPQQVQSDVKSNPAGPAPDSAPPGNSCLASLGTATSGLDRVSGSIAFFSWWWPTAKALLLFTSPHGRGRQEPLSQHPPEASPWGDAARGQAEAGGPPFISPDGQRLLEILISRRAGLMLKAEEKTGSLLGQMRPGCLLSSLGALLRSLSSKQASSAPQLFWRPRHQCTQLQGPPRLSAPQVFGDHLEKKCSQLFWGLPSLHSESLVATAWVSKGPTLSRAPTVRFNVDVSSSPVQTQSSDPPQLSQAQPLPPNPLAQPQSLTENFPFRLVQVHTQPQLPCSFPSLPSPSLHKGRTCRSSCPTSQDKARSIIPTDNQEMDWPLQMPLQRKWAARSFLQNPQEGAGQPTPSLPQGSWASQTCQCEANNRCDSCQSSQPSETADKRNKAVQEMGSVFPRRHSRKYAVRSHLDKPSKDLEQDRYKQQHASHIQTTSSVKVLEDNRRSDSDLNRPRKWYYEDCKLRSPDKKHLRKTLKAHLDKKLRQIKEDRIPVRVRRSWISASLALPKSDAHTKSRNLLALKGQHSGVNTSQELDFLDPLTRHMLEAHIKRLWAQHRWGLEHLQNLEPLNVNSDAAQVLLHPQCTSPSSVAGKSEASVRANTARFLGDPQKGAREKMMGKKSVPPLEKPFPAPSPACKEVRRALGRNVSCSTSGFSEVPRTRQEAMPLTEPPASSWLGRVQQSKTEQGTGKGSSEVRSSAAVARDEPQQESRVLASPDPSQLQKIKRSSQPAKAKETREASEDQKHSAWEVTVGASVKTFSQTIDVSLSFKSQGTGKCPRPMRTAAGCTAGQAGQRSQVVNEVEVKVQLDAERQPQGQVAGIKHRDRSPKVLPTADISASQASWTTSQRTSSSNDSASPGLPDHPSNARSSQVQQQPRISKSKAQCKSESNISPSDRREVSGRPDPVQREERAVGPRASWAHGTAHPAWDRETGDTLGDESSPFLTKKGQAPPESHKEHRTRPFVQCPNPIKKGTGRRDTLPGGRPASATAWDQGSRVGRTCMERRDAEAQAVITVVGKIMLDHLGLPHGRGISEIDWYTVERQAPLRERSCYHRGPSYTQQSRAGTDTAFGHQATPQGLSCPVKSRWLRDRGSNWVSPPREPACHSSPGQHRPRVTGDWGRPVHCPRNCLLQRGASSPHTQHASQGYPSGKSFLSEKRQFLQRKPAQSFVPTSFM